MSIVKLQAAGLLAALIVSLACSTAFAECTGCYTWETQQSGFGTCYYTCYSAVYIPGDPGEQYCEYYGPLYDLHIQYYPNAEPDYEHEYQRWFIVFQCEFLNSDTCPPRL